MTQAARYRHISVVAPQECFTQKALRVTKWQSTRIRSFISGSLKKAKSASTPFNAEATSFSLHWVASRAFLTRTVHQRCPAGAYPWAIDSAFPSVRLQRCFVPVATLRLQLVS